MFLRQQNKNGRPFSKGWLLLMSLVIGAVYLFLTPPWQQNDEPSQFEYVWLVANLDHWPQPGDVDNRLRRDVLASVLKHRLNSGSEQQYNLDLLPDPVDIGVPQLDGMPLYYFLASLPLRLFHPAEITQQLYLARLVSLALFLFTVFCAIQTANLLFGNHLIGWMLSVFIALLPQLAYRMTAVNDDAAAVASMSFFVWMCARGIKNGADWKSIFGIIASVILCLLSKTTAWLAVPFGFLALLLTILHSRQSIVWASAFSLSFLGILFAFQWDAALPASYYQYKGDPIRVRLQHAADGKYTFMTEKEHNGFYQVIDKSKLNALTAQTNRTVTLGVWVWSNQPVKAALPMLLFNGDDVLRARSISITEKPVFHTIHGQFPENYRTPVLHVLSSSLPDGVKVYWDCLILVPGEQSGQIVPRTSENCEIVDWDGYSGENIVRNPSAEQGWLPLREKAAAAVSRLYRLRVTDFWAVFDPPTSRPYYKNAALYLFRTFWGRFNWGTLPLVGTDPYKLFAVLSVLAVVGNLVALWRYSKVTNWNLLTFFMLLVAAQLAFTLSRFVGESWDMYYKLLPQARYFFPVILPTAFFICVGWYSLIDVSLTKAHLKDKFIYPFIGLFLLYNSWAWYTIWLYWYG